VRNFSPAGKQIKLSFDEWNLWYKFYSDLYLSNFNLRDGLWVASALNMHHRHAPDLELANIAQMVNCLGIICSTEKGTFPTASALVYRIYVENAGNEVLPCGVNVPALPGAARLPALDVSATRQGGRLAIFMVNRHLDADIESTFELGGLQTAPSAKRIELHHPDAFKYNTVQEPQALQIRERNEMIQVESSRFSLKLPAHSLTCVVLDVKEG